MAVSAAVKDEVVAAIREYTGRKVDASKVEVFADPKVSGCYAARWTKGKDDTVDMLFTNGEITADGLEEVEFKSWPPTSGAPKFFW